MKTSIAKYGLIVLFLLSTSLEALAQHTEYYSSLPLRESPYPRHMGIVGLSKDEALTRKHYRIEYDAKNRVTSISFWHRNLRERPNHTANYFFQTSSQRVAYVGNQEIVTFYDEYEGLVTLAGGVVREVYTLDDRGKRVALHFENAKGENVENRWDIARYEWEVQHNGSVIENRYGLKGEGRSIRPGFDFYRIQLYYEPNGMLALMTNIDEKGAMVDNSTGVAQDRLQFDDAGKWYGWHVFDAAGNLKEGNGPGVAKGFDNPDVYAYETGLRYEDRKGGPILGSSGFWQSRRVYDAWGNYDITWFEDQHGKPMINELHHYTYADYTWDPSGKQLISIAFLGVNKEQVIRRGGYHKMFREYDERGRNTKLSYLGLDGKLVNRSDNGIAYMIFEYNEKNQRVATKRFDKDGKAL